MTSHKFNFISATKKISTFVLKGASYIAFSTFSKYQDGENFPSPRIVKTFQQQIFKKISTANFKKFSTAEFWTQNTVEFCYQQRWQSEAKNFQHQNFEQVTKLWQVTNLTCKLNCATCKLWQSHKFDFISATKKISRFVLKGASYIAFWKFSKSKIFKNGQQQIFKNFQQQIFKKISTANFQKNFNSRTQNTEHCGMNFVTSKGGKN